MRLLQNNIKTFLVILSLVAAFAAFSCQEEPKTASPREYPIRNFGEEPASDIIKKDNNFIFLSKKNTSIFITQINIEGEKTHLQEISPLLPDNINIDSTNTSFRKHNNGFYLANTLDPQLHKNFIFIKFSSDFQIQNNFTGKVPQSDSLRFSIADVRLNNANEINVIGAASNQELKIPAILQITKFDLQGNIIANEKTSPLQNRLRHIHWLSDQQFITFSISRRSQGEDPGIFIKFNDKARRLETARSPIVNLFSINCINDSNCIISGMVPGETEYYSYVARYNNDLQLQEERNIKSGSEIYVITELTDKTNNMLGTGFVITPNITDFGNQNVYSYNSAQTSWFTMDYQTLKMEVKGTHSITNHTSFGLSIIEKEDKVYILGGMKSFSNYRNMMLLKREIPGQN